MKELKECYEFTKDQIAELEQLRQRVASQDTLIAEQNRLNKERQEWALHTNEVIRELNKRVAELESASFNNDIIQLNLCEKLAASQLENKRLRSALEPFVKYNSSKPVIDLAIRTSDIAAGREALSTPTDTEALEKYVLERLGEPVGYYFRDDPAHMAMPGSGFSHALPDHALDITPLYAPKEKP